MNMDTLEQGAAVVRSEWPSARPEYGLLLGSGWGEVAGAFEVREQIEYGIIPGLGRTGVEGHKGKLFWGDLAGKETFVFQGRRHFYEGLGWTPIALPIYVLKKFGCETVILTNASGGIQSGSKPGDLMLIEDHINMMGGSPLIGPHHEFWGRRFTDQSEVYDPALRDKMAQAGNNAGIHLLSGIYLGTPGPTYETPAEVRAFKALGADAVGMSTVPEASLANASGMRVGGISCITNFACGMTDNKLSHDEVEEIGRKSLAKLRSFIEQLWHLL